MKNIILTQIIIFLFLFSIGYTNALPLTSNIAHVYSFDTSKNPTTNYLVDEVGNLNFSSAGITQNQSGKKGESYLFGSYLSKSGTLDLTGNPNLTISIWVKYTATTNFMNIMHVSNTAPNFIWGVNWGSTGNINVGLNSADVTISGSYNDGNWHNLVTRIYSNNNSFEVFVDGAYKGRQTIGTYSLSNSYFYLGYQESTSGRDYTGYMDEFYIWNRTLSNSEILELNSTFYPFPSSSDIYVANNTFSNYSINFTSEGGQNCGYGTLGQYVACGPTDEETPTFKFKTQGYATCKLWNESLNYTSLNNKNISDCATTGYYDHVCTFPSPLLEATHTLYISCKNSDNTQLNNFSLSPSNSFNITINVSAAIDGAITEGITNSVVWPGATLYTNQQVYLRNLNNQQVLGRVDKVVVYGNQRWLINYDSSTLNLFNLTPVVYSLEMANITTIQIKSRVAQFINLTKN